MTFFILVHPPAHLERAEWEFSGIFSQLKLKTSS